MRSTLARASASRGSIGAEYERPRVDRWKSAHLTFTVTVRPRAPVLSHQSQTSSAIPSTRASIAAGSVRSSLNVVSEPDDLRSDRAAPAARRGRARWRDTRRPICRTRLQRGERLAAQIAPVSRPSRCIFAAVTGPTPWNFATGSVSTKALAHVGGDGELAVGLAVVGGQFGEELVVGNPGRRRQAGLGEDARADFPRGRPGGRQAAQIVGYVEIGLVERQRLDQRRVVGEDRVGSAATRRDRPRIAAARRSVRGTCASPSSTASPSARRTPAPRSSPRRPRHAWRRYPTATGRPAQRGIVALFHRRIEGVHVDMDDLANRGGVHGLEPSTARTKRELLPRTQR